LIDVAVPANLRCGRPGGDVALPDEPKWAPLTYTFAGVWEIEPAMLEELRDGVQIVDVREEQEFDDVLGAIVGARRIPLSQLAGQAATLDRTRPVVTVCRAGARSAQATVLLRKAGFDAVANLAGGMLRWRAQGLPVDDGHD
jgi:rhodanese-related sulfurtransferase